uniref:Uncharacterized protein n=1 Tax=viral metagenome TaxID=1070528 RepID=A0A6C0BWP6_9ZZZZ
MNVNVRGDLEEKCGNCEGLPPKYVTEYGLMGEVGQQWTFPKFGNEKIA